MAALYSRKCLTNKQVGEHTPFSTKMAVKLESMFLFSREIRLKTALTVADGDASVRFADPTRPPDTIDKIISSILAPIGKLIKLTHSHEQKKRYKEMQTKTDDAIEKSIGERRHEMFVIASLMTHPAKQGRGYGTALVKAVTEQADAMGRATWLHSSNTKANTGFYRSLGFVTVAESVIGDDNPNWKGEPFVTAIMVREPLQQSAWNTSLLNTRAGEAA